LLWWVKDITVEWPTLMYSFTLVEIGVWVTEDSSLGEVSDWCNERPVSAGVW